MPRQDGDGELLVLYGICPQRHPPFIGSLVVDPCVDMLPLESLASFLGLYLRAQVSSAFGAHQPSGGFCCLPGIVIRRQGTRRFHLHLNIPFLLLMDLLNTEMLTHAHANCLSLLCSTSSRNHSSLGRRKCLPLSPTGILSKLFCLSNDICLWTTKDKGFFVIFSFPPSHTFPLRQ